MYRPLDMVAIFNSVLFMTNKNESETYIFENILVKWQSNNPKEITNDNAKMEFKAI